MSFLVDPPLLVAAGAASNRIGSPTARRAAEPIVLAAFLTASISLYANASWTRPLWRVCRAESGRDWMLNSGVTRFEHRHPRAGVHLIAAALFALYPAWYRLGTLLRASAPLTKPTTCP